MYIFIALIIPAVVLAYFFTEYSKKKDYTALNNSIDLLFKGKYEICDCLKTTLKGKLYKITPGWDFIRRDSADFIYYEENGIRTPYRCPKDNEGKSLYEYFLCTSGGWKLVMLKKDRSNSFSLSEMYSENMAFKGPEYNIVTEYNQYIGNREYKFPSFRGSVQDAYDGALDFILEDENINIVPDSYDDIYNFAFLLDNLNTKFYCMDVINKNISDSSYIYNGYWMVWYREENVNTYFIKENDSYYNKYWFLCTMAFFGGLFITVFGVLKIMNR